MPRDCVTTAAAPKSPAYSQAVEAAGLVFVSGQAGIDPATGELAGTTVQEPTRQCLKNVSAILDAAGELAGQDRQRHVHLAGPGGLCGDE
jgi:2-iminobutanoate/2-iminopropanoate deaminase